MFDKLRYIKDIRAELLNIEDNAKQIEVLTESQWTAIRASQRLLGEYLDALSQPFLPSNLDEAAEEQANLIYPENIRMGHVAKHDVNLLTRRGFIKGFKAGAEWMAGQGVTKEAVIGMATEEISINVSEQTLDKLNLCPGDKVIVQIRKAK